MSGIEVYRLSLLSNKQPPAWIFSQFCCLGGAGQGPRGRSSLLCAVSAGVDQRAPPSRVWCSSGSSWASLDPSWSLELLPHVTSL